RMFAATAALTLLALVPAGRGQEEKEKSPDKLTAQKITQLAKGYEADLEAAKDKKVDKKFSAEWFEQAAAFAKQGAGALKGGRLLEARHNYRRARWTLPSLPAVMPEHVSFILGNGKLRHGNGVNAVAFNKSGTRLATAGGDGLVKVWDVANGRLITHFANHTS